ncbi:MAG: POTRA domain-containing protein, partial [Candidatus Caldatribacteriota bacterium]
MKKIKRNSNYLFLGIVVLLFFSLLVNYGFAQNNGRITAIVVRGNENIDTKFIVSQISSNIGDLFSKDKIQTDMKAIFDLGYFQDVQVKLEPFRDGYRVVFEVKENALIKDIIIEGSSILEEQEIKEVM